MRETPIIMSGDHPKLILDLQKTMTRRVIKLKNYHRNVWDYCVPHNGERAELLGEPYLKVPYDEITDNAGTRITCPYGQVGDRLWVRETFCEHTTGGVIYRADEEPSEGVYSYHRWRPSIHMPRWASRITLEITEVRVERVQEISFEDIYAEGCPCVKATIFVDPANGYEIKARVTEWFADLWDSLNAKRGYSWSSNPFCWVLSFMKLEENRNGY